MPRSERVELVSFGSPRFRSVEAGGLLVNKEVQNFGAQVDHGLGK